MHHPQGGALKMKKTRTISFAKMSGSGNDFVVFDNRNGKLNKDLSEFAQSVCKRRVGIGADGMILIEKDDECDFLMRYFNADGSEAEMCGNGGRCVALYAHVKEIAGRKMRFRSKDGIHAASVNKDAVKLKMSDPAQMDLEVPLELTGREVSASYVHTGVPHVVVAVEDVKKIDMLELGKEIRYLPKFQPDGTNVDFVQVLPRGRLKVRTYERGVEDETLACGTGCVAVALVEGIKKGLRSPVHCATAGGEVLKVHFRRDGESITNVFLDGAAVLVFEGKLPASLA